MGAQPYTLIFHHTGCLQCVTIERGGVDYYRRGAQQNSYMGAYPGVGACPGHYGILKLHVIKEVMIIIH